MDPGVGYSSFIGRVGALAVALGVGVGFTLAMPALAWADDTGSSSPTDTSSSSTKPDTEPSNDPEPEEDSDASDDTSAETDDDETEADESREPDPDTDEPTDETPPESDTSEPPVDADQPVAQAPDSTQVEPPAEGFIKTLSPAPQTVSRRGYEPVAQQVDPHDPEKTDSPVPAIEDTPETVDAAVLDEPADAALQTAPGLTGRFTAARADSHKEPNSAPVLDISPDVEEEPAPSLSVIADTAVNVVTDLVAAILSPATTTPAQPLVVIPFLDWLRREVQRTFSNRSPNAAEDSYTTSEGVDVVGNVLTNDTDADDDALQASLVDGPDHGDLTLNADGTFVYTPDDNYSGPDSFTYKVKDAGVHLHGLLGFLSPDQGHSDTARVTFTITPAEGPVLANDDSVVGDEDTSVDIDVLANDTGGDGGPLEVTLSSWPVNGDLWVNPGENTLTYRPSPNFFGTETFTYTVSDGATSDTATVTVTVNPVDDVPVSAGDNYAVTAGETLTVAAPGVLANDTEHDGDPLTAVKYSDPTHGTVTLKSDGSFTYVSDADFAGIDQFEYYAYDGISYINISYVNITVTQEIAPVAGYDSVATAAGTPVTIDSDYLLRNDFDNEDDPSTVVVTQAPESGELVVNGDGTYTYTPEDGFVGVDSFRYAAADANGESAPAIVSIFVGIPANTAPEAVADYLTAREDAPRVITPADLVANDTDADGDFLTHYAVTDPVHGTLVYNVGGTYTYTPDEGFVGHDTFYYTAFDGYADSTPTEVTIGVGGYPFENTPPVADYDSLGTDINTPLTISPDTLLVNDFDADGDLLSATVTQQPRNGTLSTDTAGNLVYTPDDGFTGTDSFYYSAVHPLEASLPAEVTINVGGPANTAPEATADYLITPFGVPLTITTADLVGNDVDADGDDLTVYVVSDPTAGTLVDDGDGTLTYTPDDGTFGPVSFSYTAFDGEADSIPTLVTIDVGGLGPNTPPVANDDFLSTGVDTPFAITLDDLIGNDVDPDGDSSLLNPVLIAPPSHGVISTDGSAVYTPDPGFVGVDEFTYQADDGRDVSNVATVYITVGQQL